jgi:hypothetical protein
MDLACVPPQVIPGELTIVSGVPNSGKSEWLDALLFNLAWQYGWCFAMCSLEKKAGVPLACLPLGVVGGQAGWKACI